METEAPREPHDDGARIRTTTWFVLGIAAMAVLGLFSVRCELGPNVAREYPSRTLPPEPQPVLMSAPPPDEDYYPCSDCHELEDRNPQPRELEDEHDDLELAHGDLWCLSCHDLADSDSLKLSDETLVGFDESWRLCTQCHGNKLAEWRAGVHGKRTGYWWGPKEYRTCIVCHNPHSPAWKPIEPLPPPRPPQQIAGRVRAEPSEVRHEEP
ncbi:MAG: hypothetical protein JSU66_01330 [Deltaproteobacteria bacterium]|nr:MAG: hypothetical protein JSU66_01330 [Deltaproteobacteria bacterium]